MNMIQQQGLDAMPPHLHRRDEGHVNYGLALVKAVEQTWGNAAEGGPPFCMKQVMFNLHCLPGRTNMRRPLIRPRDWVYAIVHVHHLYPEVTPMLWEQATSCHSDIINRQMRADIEAQGVSLPASTQPGWSR